MNTIHITNMAVPNKCNKIRKILKAYVFLHIKVCLSAENIFFQLIFQIFFVFVVLKQIAGITFVMWKSKIICNIMDNLSKTSPEYPLTTPAVFIFNQCAKLFLDIRKGAEKLMSLRHKGGTDIRKDVSQTKSLSVRLQTF